MKLNRNKFKGEFRKKLKNVKTFESFSVNESKQTRAEKVRELYPMLNIVHLLLDEGYLDDELNLSGNIGIDDVLSFLKNEEGIDMTKEYYEDLIAEVKHKLR